MIRLRGSSSLFVHDRTGPVAGALARAGSIPAIRPRIVVGQRARVAVLSIVLAIFWILLLGWAADAPFGAPFEPAQRIHHNGADFHVVMGAGVENGRRLGINAVGAERMALQSRALEHPIDAESFPILRYRWDDFPRTLELSFVFRRAEDPNDVQTITLPPAAAHPAYFDLRDVPAWRGRITEIGFAEFPTAQLVPTDIAFRPFALNEAELWSPSWRGSLGALGTDWTAYRPWALMSVSALGPDAPWPHKATPVIVFAAGLFASIALAAVVLARDRRWLGTSLCVALAIGWVALDLRWLGEFTDRHVLTRELYAGKSWRERSLIEPDTPLVQSAARVRDLLAREPPDAHVIIAADTVYDMLRLNYHLLPANVAPASALAQPGIASMPVLPALLVVYADADWKFDAEHGVVESAELRFAADVLLDEEGLKIFRLRGAAQ